MKVTYIGHSGFLVETQSVYLLFDCVAAEEMTPEVQNADYSMGLVPAMDPEKELVVFVSHRHPDHYGRIIWKLKQQYPKIRYVIPSGISPSPKARLRRGITDAHLPLITKVDADRTYELPLEHGGSLKIETLCSTDEGVAFYLTVDGHTVYHAGDLHLWLWEEEDESWNRDMEQRFAAELEKLRARKTDVAFLPLDPRLGRYTCAGMDAYLEAMDIRQAFPMHFWKQYDLIGRYKKERADRPYVSAVREITEEGQTFELP